MTTKRSRGSDGGRFGCKGEAEICCLLYEWKQQKVTFKRCPGMRMLTGTVSFILCHFWWLLCSLVCCQRSYPWLCANMYSLFPFLPHSHISKYISSIYMYMCVFTNYLNMYICNVYIFLAPFYLYMCVYKYIIEFPSSHIYIYIYIYIYMHTLTQRGGNYIWKKEEKNYTLYNFSPFSFIHILLPLSLSLYIKAFF